MALAFRHRTVTNCLGPSPQIHLLFSLGCVEVRMPDQSMVVRQE